MMCRFSGVLVAVIAISVNAWGHQLPPNGSSPIYIPLNMVETPEQAYTPMIRAGIGSLSPLSVTLDTGSVGLRVFAVRGIPGNGTICSGPTTTVSYGNPVRVSYAGVICYGPISLAGGVSTPSIPFALLTSMTYCEPGYSCKTPQENYAAGIYGVLGVGMDAGSDLPNPLRTLDGTYGMRFMLRLNADASKPSSLILAPPWHYDAAIFPQAEQTAGALNLANYAKGAGCVLLNGQQTSVCPLISFDTGNGVPWVHATIPHLPTVPGGNGITYVAPGTMIGVAPRLGGPAAVSVIASGSFAGEFRYADQNSNLINVSVQAFFGNDVTYDSEQGVITVAPTPVDDEQ
jgi:hypothetical protein